jgi:nicotinate-nucleotide adenylyltransferase
VAERTSRAPRRAGGPRRLGLFGGTFDPPHLGHLVLAECARDQLGLERVVFMPSAQPPHKAGRRVTPVRERVAMTRLAVRGRSGFEVSTLETRRRGPSYTVDTLRALRRREPSAEWVLVLGQDSLRELHTWREPDQIRALATLAVARRVRGPGERAGRSARARVRWIAMPRIDVSSRDLRRRVQAGESVRFLVPDAVERYLRRRRLYRGRRGPA